MRLFTLCKFNTNWHLVKWKFKPARLSNVSPQVDQQDVRFNAVNVQLLPGYIRDHIFGGASEDTHPALVEMAAEHLKSHGIKFCQNTKISEVPKPHLVPLQGSTIVEHFHTIAAKLLNPYTPLISKLCECDIPQPPTRWEFAPGWLQYGENGPREVPYPDEDALVLDVETCVKEGLDPVLATAVSPSSWYAWVSPRLVDKNDDWQPENLVRRRDDLIPIRGENDQHVPKIIVGQYVSFDRARLREEYDIATSSTYFLDTMALHICVNGVTSDQRLKWMKNDAMHKKEGCQEDADKLPAWMEVGSPAALQYLYKLYTGRVLDKSPRDIFLKGNFEEIRDNFQTGISYCAKDVIATLEIFQNLFPLFQQSCPSPVTQVGMMEMGSAYMPTSTRDWSRFVTNCDQLQKDYNHKTSDILIKIADNARHLSKDNNYLLDPWLSTLDWTLLAEKKNETRSELQRLKWYDKHISLKRKELSAQKQLVPRLLRLVWGENPLYHVDHLGWGYIVPATAENDTSSAYKQWMHYLDKFVAFLKADSDSQHSLRKEVRALYAKFNNDATEYKQKFQVIDYIQTVKLKEPSIITKDILARVKSKAYETDFGKAFGRVVLPGFKIPFDFYRIPHKDGENSNCGKPLSKDYLAAMQEKKLKSRFTESGEEDIFHIEKSISFWRSNCRRIMEQMVVSGEDGMSGHQDVSVILPNLCVAGTVTRRAVQSTWLTASNPERDRIGSELKTLITAPPDHMFVGADVDAQELWIAALLADSHFARIHGCTAIGWMTLQGDKSRQTDLHSRTAQSLKITRNQAKIINYARIYGSGVNHTTRLLKNFLPEKTIEELKKKALKLHRETKGVRKSKLPLDDMHFYKKARGQTFSNSDVSWSEGTESYLFNKLEEIANCREPRTPALNCRISSALLPDNVGNGYYTSRMNWVVQSSGVDYLHLLIVSMKWLMTEFGISGRYSFSIHDEIKFLVKEREAERAALALQLSNLYTRSLFAFKTQVPDLPLSVAFFSGVEIDKVIRKNPTDECITLSNIRGISEGRNIPHGRTLDIYEILKFNDSLEKTT